MHNPPRMSGRLLNAMRAACATRSSFGFGLLLALVACLAGCGGADNRPAKWSYIAPAIIEPNCATVSCHSSVAQRAGVILDTGANRVQHADQPPLRRHLPTIPMPARRAWTSAVDTSEILVLAARPGLAADAPGPSVARSGHSFDPDLDRQRSAEQLMSPVLAPHINRRCVRFRGCCSLASAREAHAYPQFQFSSGTTRCGQCHYSPSGGTLISSWGRDEAGDTISLGGDGSFLHGLWAPPAWLALGLDLRLAALRNDVGGADSPEVAFFPMQADLYTRLRLRRVLAERHRGRARRGAPAGSVARRAGRRTSASA